MGWQGLGGKHLSFVLIDLAAKGIERRSGRSPLKPSGGRFGLRPGAHAFCRAKKALDP